MDRGVVVIKKKFFVNAALAPSCGVALRRPFAGHGSTLLDLFVETGLAEGESVSDNVIVLPIPVGIEGMLGGTEPVNSVHSEHLGIWIFVQEDRFVGSRVHDKELLPSRNVLTDALTRGSAETYGTYQEGKKWRSVGEFHDLLS